MRKIVLILLIANFFTVALNKLYSCDFILITTLYNETNPERIDEYIICLKHNLANPEIEKIHVIYDTHKDTTENPIHDFLITQDIIIDYTNTRPTYGDCFKLANTRYPNKKIILTNADIYFNETLGLLYDYDLTDKFLALTRWNINTDGTLKPYFKNIKYMNSASQDTWIFSTPLRKFTKDTFKIGTLHCDNYIAYWAKESGLKVINPCFSIQCCHFHLSEIRNYNTKKLLPFSGPYLFLPRGILR